MTGFSFQPATAEDAAQVAALHNATAERLTRSFGVGAWSFTTTRRAVLDAMQTRQVFVAREGSQIIGTLALTGKKPWAIDLSLFTKCRQPLYLLAMAVAPERQRQGIGRHCLEYAKRIARSWPADAIRLDAYDAPAGAGPFYAKCGWTEVNRAAYRSVPLIYYELLLGPGPNARLSM